MQRKKTDFGLRKIMFQILVLQLTLCMALVNFQIVKALLFHLEHGNAIT